MRAQLKSKKEVRESGVAHEIFRLINDAYEPLFGFSRMTERQIDQYVNMYVPVLDLRMVSIVENAQNEIVAVGISMASLSRALQKAKGRLLPFGWWHLLRALKFHKTRIVDLEMIGVLPEYRPKGANALMFAHLIPIYQEYGFEWGESQVEMETNEGVQSQWQYLETVQHKRRRCYKKNI